MVIVNQAIKESADRVSQRGTISKIGSFDGTQPKNRQGPLINGHRNHPEPDTMVKMGRRGKNKR
jgi:hypothetical protein